MDQKFKQKGTNIQRKNPAVFKIDIFESTNN